MKNIFLIFFASFGLVACTKDSVLEISRDNLIDKIKGGWAGQAIGVVFGGDTEFQYLGTFIQDYQRIRDWEKGIVGKTMQYNPGLFDDIYMDLTFVDVIEREGLDAPQSSFAKRFAEAEFPLWHANQAARYNVLNGIKNSGHWLVNPHADDLDYQIEADFAGIMSPAMPNASDSINDRVGHIMNYGDGWYGGVYVSAMYSLAFASNDIKYVVEEALKKIPANTRFYNAISDTIKWYKKYPNDWKRTWFELQKKYAEDRGCPECVLRPMNIDTCINGAYIVLGLLYGNGDFEKTMEISTRAGQDSDCNPASACGILGVMIGYKNIPQKWKDGLIDSEDKKFLYTTMSLNDTYAISFKHAIAMIEKNNGKIDGDKIIIKKEKPTPVKYEQCFENTFPVKKTPIGATLGTNDKNLEKEVEFEGTGFAIRGSAEKTNKAFKDSVIKVAIYLDGKLMEKINLPTSFTTRRYEVSWKFQLNKGKHNVKVRVENPNPEAKLYLKEIISYSDKPYSLENN